MRKEYGKVLREVFEKEMKARLPQFEPVKASSMYILPGERAFRWVAAEPTHCWILLCPDQKGREAFTVELGWSRLGRFPQLSMRPSFDSPSTERSEFAREEYVCRLGTLIAGEDMWWELESMEFPDSPEAYMAYLENKVRPVTRQDAILLVEPQVEDAIEKLVHYAVPYLEEFAESARPRTAQA